MQTEIDIIKSLQEVVNTHHETILKLVEMQNHHQQMIDVLSKKLELKMEQMETGILLPRRN